MAQKYIVSWCERKHIDKLGKDVMEATLQDENMVETDKVTLWENNWDFSKVIPGYEIVGDLIIKKQGKYTNKTLYPEKTDTMSSPRAPAWATKMPSEIKKAQERKAEDIKEAQEHRAEGVKVASTFRDATLITAQLIQPRGLDTDELIQKEWTKWRNWLWKNYDNEQPPF